MISRNFKFFEWYIEEIILSPLPSLYIEVRKHHGGYTIYIYRPTAPQLLIVFGSCIKVKKYFFQLGKYERFQSIDILKKSLSKRLILYTVLYDKCY